jgi:LacI family transcriptional regulator
MEERFPDAVVTRLFEMPEADDAAYEMARELLTPVAADLAGVYNVGPASFGVARALAEMKTARPPMFVANDLLEVHRTMLMSGALSYVINQDLYSSISSASRVLRGLCDGVRGALSLGNPRVEILTAENLA